MEGEVSHFQAGHVLKAATRLREEVCGPLAQRVEVSGSLSLEQLVAVAGAAKPSQEEEVAKSGEESVALPSEAADTEHV